MYVNTNWQACSRGFRILCGTLTGSKYVVVCVRVYVLCLWPKKSANSGVYAYISGQWYIMTLADWTMSCQPGGHVPVTVSGQRWKYHPWAYKLLYRLANFNGVYVNWILVQQKQLKFLYDIDKGVLIICTQYWSDVMIGCRVNRCNFTWIYYCEGASSWIGALC